MTAVSVGMGAASNYPLAHGTTRGLRLAAGQPRVRNARTQKEAVLARGGIIWTIVGVLLIIALVI